jgi:hypothetical protein
MVLEAKGLEMFKRGFSASRIVATVEVSGDGQAGLSSGGTNEVENLLIAVERFTGPVLGDLRKRQRQPLLPPVSLRMRSCRERG